MSICLSRSSSSSKLSECLHNHMYKVFSQAEPRFFRRKYLLNKEALHCKPVVIASFYAPEKCFFKRFQVANILDSTQC